MWREPRCVFGSQNPVLVTARLDFDGSSNSLCLASATSWNTSACNLSGNIAEFSATKPSNHRGCSPWKQERPVMYRPVGHTALRDIHAHHTGDIPIRFLRATALRTYCVAPNAM